MRKHGRKFLALGVIVAAVVVLGAAQAEATWWRCCGPVASCYTPCTWSCCTPCYTPCTVSCCDPCCGGWYLGVRPGPVRRLVFGPYRWYYGCGVGCCCWDPCCVAYDACAPVMDTGTTVPQTPTRAPGKSEGTTPAPSVNPPANPPAGEKASASVLPTSMRTKDTRGLLNVWVPPKAKVYINGMETKTNGTQRQYVSYGLKPGLVYKYVIRVELARDGKLAEETQTVYLTAGGEEGAAFGFYRPEISNVAAQ